MDELQDGQEQLKLAESRLACMVEAGGGQAEKQAQGCPAALGQDQAGAEVLQQPAQ